MCNWGLWWVYMGLFGKIQYGGIAFFAPNIEKAFLIQKTCSSSDIYRESSPNYSFGCLETACIAPSAFVRVIKSVLCLCSHGGKPLVQCEYKGIIMKCPRMRSRPQAIKRRIWGLVLLRNQWLATVSKGPLINSCPSAPHKICTQKHDSSP